MMDIEAIVEKHVEQWDESREQPSSLVRAALNELSETHAIEMRAYEATVQNLEAKVRELEAERVPDGWKPVPIEPTDAMVDAACILSSFPTGVYAAMLAAAPQQKKEGE